MKGTESWTFLSASFLGLLWLVDYRAPKDHINMRILQTMISGIPLILGLWNQNMRSLCSFRVLGPKIRKFDVEIIRNYRGRLRLGLDRSSALGSTS